MKEPQASVGLQGSVLNQTPRDYVHLLAKTNHGPGVNVLLREKLFFATAILLYVNWDMG